nr:DUF4367 domain-containing protein [uncultured Bacteroides sp.]
MNRQEELQDRYEDALFALLMDKIATAEGKEALEEIERLKSDPDAAIPENVDKRCLQTIRRHFAKQKVHTVGRFTMKVVKCAVIAAGIAGLMLTAAFAVSEDVRSTTLNWMIEVFDTDTTLRFIGETSEVVPQINIGWLPDGYALESCGYSGVSTWYTFQNADAQYIQISCTSTAGTTMSVDTEDADVQHVEINGYPAMFIKKKSDWQLVWPANKNSIVICIVTSDLNETELFRFANELAY